MSFKELLKFKLFKLINITFKSDTNFIYKNDFLKINDYKEAIIKLISQKKPNFSNFKHFEFELKEILDYDFKINRFNQSYLGILNYKFFKRLKEKKDLKLKKLFHGLKINQMIKVLHLELIIFFQNLNLLVFRTSMSLMIIFIISHQLELKIN